MYKIQNETETSDTSEQTQDHKEREKKLTYWRLCWQYWWKFSMCNIVRKNIQENWSIFLATFWTIQGVHAYLSSHECLWIIDDLILLKLQFLVLIVECFQMISKKMLRRKMISFGPTMHFQKHFLVLDFAAPGI